MVLAILLFSQLNYSCELLNLSTQLDNTNVVQPITKQCLILFSLWCKKFALAIKEKTLKKNMARSKKCLSIFWSQFFYTFPLYGEFLGKICHSLLYLAILTYVDHKVHAL